MRKGGLYDNSNYFRRLNTIDIHDGRSIILYPLCSLVICRGAEKEEETEEKGRD